MNRQKRVLAIHDISCIGKCSLTVAIPIISAAELECAVIPTAVLSTHTGEFTGYTFRDLTDDIEPICEHWRSFGIGFDAIYTGYLGSAKQISLVRSIIDTFGGEGKTVFVDPVMADAGRLYANFDMAFVSEMRSLCAEADVITPNLTEAAFLLGGEYRESGYGEEYIKETLGALCGSRPTPEQLTGVSYEDGKIGAAYLERGGDYGYFADERIPGFYHGTGDVFASALVAAYVRGMSMSDAAAAAVRFTTKSIRLTAAAGSAPRFGVRFEEALCDFMRDIGVFVESRNG